MSRLSLPAGTLAVGLVFSLALPLSCDSRLQELRDRVPAISTEDARHLVHDREPAYRAYAHRLGYRKLKDVRYNLFAAYDGATSVDDLETRHAFVKPYLEQVDRAFESEFDSPEYRAEALRREAMTPAQRFRLQQLLDWGAAENAKADTIVEGQLERLEDLRDQFLAIGYPRGAMFVELQMADVVMRLGRYAERHQLLKSALARARALNERLMLCQVLAALGPDEPGQTAVQDDRNLLEVYEIATRHRIPEQSARALAFMAANAEYRGHYARALDLYREAIQVCREQGGGGTELRFVVRTMTFLARLGCWDVVDRMAPRVRPLERDMTALERTAYHSWVAEGEILGARAALQLGKSQTGSETFQKHAKWALGHEKRTAYPGLVNNWSAGLYDAGRNAEALPIVEDGLRFSDSLRCDEVIPDFMLRKARLLSRLGRNREAFDTIRDLKGRLEWIPFEFPEVAIAAEALRAQLLLESGKPDEAAQVARLALVEVSRRARKMDGGPTSELALATLEDVRQVAHQTLAPDPLMGYWLEMEWRSLIANLGREGESAPPLRRLDRPRELRLAIPAGEKHIVYHVRSDAIIRWTAGANGVTRDRIPMGRDSCAALVRRAMDYVRRSGPFAHEAAQQLAPNALTELSRLLLPSGLDSGNRRLWISPDGPLTALMFEALGVGHDASRPLVEACDVAYLHSPDCAPASPGRKVPVIVADPDIPSTIRRRHPGLTELPAIRSEVALAKRAWSDARVIVGAAATRDSVLAAWEQASHIYLAAHIVQDAEVPLATFIPLASAPDGIESKAYLDPGDIRKADLSGCRLAVLSSCSGGAPYLASTGVSFGVAGAFLDAGAAAVVRTAWPIRDDDAQRFAAVFLEELAKDPEDSIGALNQARRRLLKENPQGPWFAWSIAVCGLPREHRSRALASR